ncbi:bacterial transcriptional activator domain-containing protein [Hymenobacter terricola]|uniref:bacterial transcriptional activator domain-containing protein n=1 Tax=Hymenobacter terricola TaxID=2819236 RepID=UPI001B30894D|nr:bacterial transcriptional activator domain-containing protein [Hymenobacter terricola]
MPDCNQAQQYNYVIGDPDQVTVYSGNQTFVAGDYHVIGDLYFKDGTVDIQPGAVFHIDGYSVRGGANKPLRVKGYALTLGAGSTVTATGAVFNASCTTNMWMGFAFDPGQSDQLLSLTNCGVANALYGVYVSPDCNGAYYNLDNCHFEQNLYHVLDYGYHFTNPGNASVPVCTIKDCDFYSQPNLLPPYKSATLDSWTYEALHLSPTGNNDGQPKIFLQGSNHIEGAIYGLVAHTPGQGQIFQDGGTLRVDRAVRVGIWLDVMKEDVRHFPSQVTIGMNNITAGRTYQTLWTAPAEQQYGFVASNNTGSVTDYNLAVDGVVPDTTVSRSQTGVLLDELHSPMEKLALRQLTYGVSLRAGSGLIDNNTFSGCLHGLRIRPNTGPYSANFDISCNSFTASGFATASGIYIEPNATLNNQGSLTYPVGNKFANYGSGLLTGTRSIVNNGTNGVLKYYRYSNSTDEEITSINNSANPPQQRGSVTSTTNPSYSLNNYCQNFRGVSTGVQARGTSRVALMQALMDTLRRQASSAPRLGRYQAAIREWLLQEQPDTAALDAYVRTLPLANANAFYGLGLDLLEQYRRTGRSVLAAALRPVLAARIAAYPAANDRLALSDVLSHMGQKSAAPLPGQRLVSAADSTTLHRLARTPGGTAEMAALWFNYLYPNVGIRAAVPRLAGSGSAASAARLTTSYTLFPNPATDQLHVEVTAPVGQAVLRLADLLSGKVVLQAELIAGDKGMRQADVNVRAIPAGQYAATFLVDGVPVTTQKVLINR